MTNGSHSGGTQPMNSDCEGCHAHNGDASGGWRATESCASNAVGCHGTDGGESQPNGAAYPDRAGKHSVHIAAIAAANSLSTTGTQTCNWCHPGGVHSGDQAATPANLMDGATTHFKAIKGAVDSGEAVTQAGANVTCAGVNCHYNGTMPAADWYGTPSGSCAYCHADGVATYTANQLPNAHNQHVDEVADGGYDYACSVCHPSGGYTQAHQSATVAVSFTGVPWGIDGDEATTGGNGQVKYGAGTVASYYGCAGISCHGDYSGGNTANTPNWYNTDAVIGGTNGDGRCGTCHGNGAVAVKDPVPIYADGTPKANKHNMHHTVSGFGCQDLPLHGDHGRRHGDRTGEPREQYELDGCRRGRRRPLPVHLGVAELHDDGVPRRPVGGVERGGGRFLPPLPQLRGRRGVEHGRE